MIFTNTHWLNRVLFASAEDRIVEDNYVEYICTSYCLHPIEDQIASINKLVFDPKKAAALYFWYKSADKKDKSIVKHFEEYKNCVDDTHQWFNSNYGIYAYKQKGLERCIDVLAKNSSSRQACFCINNNSAMAPESIDKLCTNAVQFLIRNKSLIMAIQMRSSNMLTLLPYDFFIFSVWYAFVFKKLITLYPTLKVNNIHINATSLHYYKTDYAKKDVREAPITNLTHIFSLKDIYDYNFENILEERLIEFLKD